jgi:hypothetical protein
VSVVGSANNIGPVARWAKKNEPGFVYERAFRYKPGSSSPDLQSLSLTRSTSASVRGISPESVAVLL